ncbi:MAG TPA: tyrosine-type recombinase/integrase [Bauldia sp.]
MKTAFASGVRQAGLSGKVTAHTLRHTAATWLMQAGVDVWEAAGFLGMSVQILERVYGHHHPAHLRSAALAIGYRPRRVETLVESLVVRPVEPTPIPEGVEIIGGPGRTRTCNQIVMSASLSLDLRVFSIEIPTKLR